MDGFKRVASAPRLSSGHLRLSPRAPLATGINFDAGRAGGVDMLLGESEVMRTLRSRVAQVGPTNFTVLIEGESGVGKEVAARALHQVSPRRQGPFVAVNCAALVETLLEAELFGIEERIATGVGGRRGKFELAERGTLFLDEVADLSPNAQAKLLRVLQDLTVERVGGHLSRTVDTRVIAATNRPLLAEVEAGRFRTDLFYRLSGVELEVLPLRRRREDIPLLVDHFLRRHRHTRSLRPSASAMDALVAYDWPGNVRQLERTMERAVALGRSSTLMVSDLPERMTHGYREFLGDREDRHATLRAWSGRYVRMVLERCDGNRRRACESLDISYHTLRSYLRSAPGARPHHGDARTTSSQGHR